MPVLNIDQTKLDFEFNIAEYMFFINTHKKVNFRREKNTISIINHTNYEKNYWEFTKKKLIWARKGDKIKNEIDYEENMLKKIKKINDPNKKNDQNNFTYKVNMFDKLNKFKKYDSLEIKNNRKIHNQELINL